MNALTHRGYVARVEYDADDRLFVGHIAGIRDIVGFHGRTVDELEAAFCEAVDDYLDACQKLGQPPNKPFSGKLMLRVPPALHAAIAVAAEVNGKSINQWATEVLDNATGT